LRLTYQVIIFPLAWNFSLLGRGGLEMGGLEIKDNELSQVKSAENRLCEVSVINFVCKKKLACYWQNVGRNTAKFVNKI